VLVNQLAKYFEISELRNIDASIISKMAAQQHLTLVSPDGTAKIMKPKSEMFNGVRNLDSAMLEHARSELDLTVAYQHGYREIIEQLATAKFSAAVLIRPVSVSEIQRTASEGLLMPPKSTFFTPKLQTGLVIRDLN
jgi:uncharacterized protein (DUF1015 family)